MKRNLFWVAVLLLSGCATNPTALIPASYRDLPYWSEDNHIEPLRLFVDSCKANASKGTGYANTTISASKWRDRCAKAKALLANGAISDTQARAFFETNFTPHRVTTSGQLQGRITGYYEPLLHGSRERVGAYQTPVYGLPTNPDDRHYSRAEIIGGALEGKAPVLLYVDDAPMLFFLHIQGSGQMQLPDGEIVGLQYVAKNELPFVPIGRVLKERGALKEVTMQTICQWLRAHPTEAVEVMNQNPTYVYFKLTDGKAYATGALGLPLTPLRSIAVDNDTASYGVPTYIATADTYGLHRLFVSQDTGSALHGPARADVFFGQGDAAEQRAGQQNALGDVYWLLPTAASD